MQSPYPLWDQILTILVMPPVIGLVFIVLARGPAFLVQSEKRRETILANQRKVALAMTGAGWIVGFGTLIYVHFIQS